MAAEVLETYVHSQRRLKTQVQELKGKLKRVSRENANLREYDSDTYFVLGALESKKFQKKSELALSCLNF